MCSKMFGIEKAGQVFQEISPKYVNVSYHRSPPNPFRNQTVMHRSFAPFVEHVTNGFDVPFFPRHVGCCNDHLSVHYSMCAKRHECCKYQCFGACPHKASRLWQCVEAWALVTVCQLIKWQNAANTSTVFWSWVAVRTDVMPPLPHTPNKAPGKLGSGRS